MGTYVWRSCPNCGYQIESGVSHYVAIGNPIYKCPSCGFQIKLDHINEWELMSFWKKFFHLLSSLKTALFFSVAVGFLISIITNIINKEIDIIWLFIISPIIAFSFTTIMVIKNISNSKIRMKNPKYRESFENIGLIKNKKQ